MNDFIKSSVFGCNVFELPKIHNRAGNITALNNNTDIPFNVQRVYYLFDIPGGETRGGHAHRELQQIIVAASGSFDVIIDDGKIRKVVSLNRPYYGLHILPGIWRELVNFSSGAICLVLASNLYNEKDYIRDYHYYLTYKNDPSSF
jgi:hypothetical protein